MPDAVQKFARLLRHTPQPSPELVLHGAYPSRDDNGNWHVSLESAAPIIDAYFERTKVLSGNNDPVFKEDSAAFDTDFLTNESHFPQALKQLENLGGVYVGVGQALTFTFASIMRASHAFALDINANIPFAFTPLYGALLAMAPTRAHFISLMLGRPLTAAQLRRLKNADPKKLWKTIAVNTPFDETFANNVRTAVTSFITGLSKLKIRVKIHMGRAISRFLSLTRSTRDFLYIDRLFNLAAKDKDGRGGLLSSEGQYRRERALFMEGRVTGVLEDLAGKKMDTVKNVLDKLNQPRRVMYISNVEDHFRASVRRELKSSQFRSFYRNLKGISAGAETTIVSSINNFIPTVFDSGSYIASAILFHLPPEEAAYIAYDFYILRRNIIMALNHGWSRHFDLNEESCIGLLGAKYFINGGKSDIPDIVKDTTRLAADAPFTREEFDSRMSSLSEAYRNLSDAQREHFIRLYEYLGFIKESAPAGYRGEAALTRPGHTVFMPIPPSAMPDAGISHATFMASMLPSINMIVGGITMMPVIPI